MFNKYFIQLCIFFLILLNPNISSSKSKAQLIYNFFEKVKFKLISENILNIDTIYDTNLKLYYQNTCDSNFYEDFIIVDSNNFKCIQQIVFNNKLVQILQQVNLNKLKYQKKTKYIKEDKSCDAFIYIIIIEYNDKELIITFNHFYKTKYIINENCSEFIDRIIFKIDEDKLVFKQIEIAD